MTYSCLHCGIPVVHSGICAKCVKRQPVYDEVISAYLYQYPVSNLIRRMKYQQDLEVLTALGSELVLRIQQRNDCLPDCLIPVPSHSFRLMQRGFNQALELARFIGNELCLSVDYSLAKRARSTTPQYDLPYKARRNNVKNAFIIRKKCNYDSVAIVDDIITSGATAEELARLLKQSGVAKISVWSLAHPG